MSNSTLDLSSSPVSAQISSQDPNNPPRKIHTMRYRSPLGVFILPFLTFGIYLLVWFASTKGEMNRLNANIPTAFILLIPLVNIWWLWEYSVGVEKISNNKLSTGVAFILLLLTGTIGMAIIQSTFNKVTD